MILDNTLKLVATLAGAIATSQPDVHVDYLAWNTDGQQTKPVPFRVALNSTTDVTILSAPTTQGVMFEPLRIEVYNKDTASATVILKTDDGATQRLVVRVTLATLETLHFEKDAGFYVTAANGAVKEGAGVSGPASSTNNGMVRWNGTDGTVIKDTSDITYDGTTYIIGSNKFTVASASGNTVVAGTLGVTGLSTLGSVAVTGAATQAQSIVTAQKLQNVFILAKSAVAVSCPADTNEDTLATITVPAGAMAANGQVTIKVTVSCTSSVNNKTINVKFGGTTYQQLVVTTTTGAQLELRVMNRNSASSQCGSIYSITDGALVAETSSGLTTAINTGNAVTVLITGTKASAGETLTLESYLVELISDGT